MGKTIDNIAKGICLILVIFASISLMGVLFGGDDNTSNNIGNSPPTATPAPTATPEPVEPSIEELVVVRSGRDHQDITVECKHLRVDSNHNIIQIANSDVESIRILGSGNSVGYSCDADPRIDDFGNYNDVWQRWLT